MSKLRLSVVTALVAAITVLAPAPARAHTFSDVFGISGVAVVGGGTVGNGGLFYPVALPCGGVCPLENHTFAMSSGGGGMDVIVGTDTANGLEPIGSGRISGTGTFFGYCALT